MACCTAQSRRLPSVPSMMKAAVLAKGPHNALQARHDSIKLFQETMAQLDHLADMVRDFQVNEKLVSAPSVQDMIGQCHRQM